MISFCSNIKIIRHKAYRLIIKFFFGSLIIVIVSGCEAGTGRDTQTASPTQITPSAEPAPQVGPTLGVMPSPSVEPSIQAESSLQKTSTPISESMPHAEGISRGYLITPQELDAIEKKAEQGIEPYQSTVQEVLQWADKEWKFKLNARANCPSSDSPTWNDNSRGTPTLYAKALAYQLTGDVKYAEEVKRILESIITEVRIIDIETEECRLVFGWGTPELVASADLIEDFWWNQTCTGPLGIDYKDNEIGTGNCKELFQNWLVKNPYYIVSYSAVSSKSNWGAAATNTTAYIADYLWDRPNMQLTHRNPREVNGGKDLKLTPSEAFKYANQLALDRMNGYGVEIRSATSCDYLGGWQQNSQWPAIKSQITEAGIIPEDARREEFCNIPVYNGHYQNYPQIHLGHNIQQCELMLRRGDSSCYDNVDNTNIPNYTFIGPDGNTKTTHLYPGRGSIERAIKAIIVDSNTEWRHDSALDVAFRYYFNRHTLPGFEKWANQLKTGLNCSQDICFGALTHGFSIESEIPDLPPIVPPP